MSSSFKIKLKRAPNATASSPAPPDSSPAPPSTSGGLHDYTDDEDEGGEMSAPPGGVEEGVDELDEEDELADELSDASPHPTSSPISNRGGASGSASTRGGASGTGLKRPAGSAQMSLQEVDALPAAKRRRENKARGAAGPGRGWRKGLKMGQKPVYEAPLGSDGLPVSATTPSSFAGGDSRGATPSEDGSVAPRSAMPSVLAKPTLSSASIAAMKAGPSSAPASGSGGEPLTFVHYKPAAPLPKSTANVRYPALPGLRGGPPIAPLGRIPVAFANTTLPRKERLARKWVAGSREILSLGGRAWGAKTWFASERPRFPTAAETAARQAAAQRAAAEHSPQPLFPQTAAAKLATPNYHPAATPLRAPAGSSPLAMRTPKAHPGVANVAANASGASSPAGSGGLDWRGSSPAFVATKKPPA